MSMKQNIMSDVLVCGYRMGAALFSLLMYLLRFATRLITELRKEKERKKNGAR